ncbi:MAG: hypothetical protein PHC85_01435 [Candidatus Pacebacteria bacterium]|nr:hypothetical protein [Candidatus Paceibacterota bacterium]
MNNSGHPKNQGLSFVGVIVATSIAIVGIFGVFNMTNYSLKAVENSKSRLIASGLAQEGVEIIRDIRKSNGDWRSWEWYSTTTPYSHPIGSSQIYCPVHDSILLIDASCADPEAPLKINSFGLYQYEEGEDTPFYRRVILSRVSNDEIKVVSEIRWQARTGWHTLNVEDRLWRWR